MFLELASAVKIFSFGYLNPQAVGLDSVRSRIFSPFLRIASRRAIKGLVSNDQFVRWENIGNNLKLPSQLFGLGHRRLEAFPLDLGSQKVCWLDMDKFDLRDTDKTKNGLEIIYLKIHVF